ncbi:putative ribonuclease H-like domain-containing protein [Tanacetum coccineum]
MCDKKNSVLFTDTGCFVLSPDFKLADESQVLLKVHKKNNMYNIDMKNIIPKESLTCLVAKATLDESMLWHRRLGHVNFKTINKLVKENLVRGLPTKRFENDQTCVACLKGKQHKASCKSKIQNSITQPLFMLHMDLFGLTFVSSLMNKKYCLVVTDDYSRFTWVFFLATKDETSGILKSFITEIENLVDKKVKIIRCDNGTEFKNKVMSEFCEQKGIKREYSVARTPQQNGVAERRNRTLIKAARTMLADSKLPTTFWAEAVNIACYVQNRVQRKRIGAGHSSKETRFSQDYILMPLWKDDSLFDSSSKNDYNDEPQPSSDAGKKDGEEIDMSHITTTCLVPSTPNTRIHKDHSLDHVIGDVQSGVLTRRMTKTTNEQGFISVVYERKTHEDLHTCMFACFLSQEEPKKVIQALKDPIWIEAILEDLLQFKLQQVWTLVDLPLGKRAIGTKWVYRNKKDERVARIEAIRLFLAYASFKDFVVYQMDVKSAFLYGKIKKEVYVCQPPGFEDLEFPNRVYKRGQIDKTLFIKRVKSDILLVQVYIDDIIFGSTKKKLCTEFETLMHKNQDKYVDEILKKFGFLTLKTASTHMETSKPLMKDAEAEDVDVHLYRSMIGSLMYLTSSRPDIMFVVCQPKLGLWYTKDSPFDLKAYSDSDYAGASLDRKSTIGAEYLATANCCGQVLWIQNKMLDYGYNFMNTKIFIDNESTICIVKNSVFHSKTKHIEIRHHFIRYSNEKKLIQMIKIHIDQNVADLLTKAFDVGRFQYLITKYMNA